MNSPGCGKQAVDCRRALFFRENRAVADKIIHSGNHREQDHDPREHHDRPGGPEGKIQNQHNADEHHLAGGFPFSEWTGRNDFALGDGNHPQTIHRKLTADDDDDDPGGHQLQVNEHDHGGQDKKLIRHRVNKLAEIRYQVAAAGNAPVEKICDAGEDEDNARGDPAGRILKIKEHHNDRNTDSAGNTEFIGQSQSISPRRSYSSASVIRTGMKRPGSGRASGQET